jgi:hypothetical protein
MRPIEKSAEKAIVSNFMALSYSMNGGKGKGAAGTRTRWVWEVVTSQRGFSPQGAAPPQVASRRKPLAPELGG